MYTARAEAYSGWMILCRHQQGLKRFFERFGGLRSDLKVLDAGCGSGATTFALADALRVKGLNYRTIDAFDLTPAMLKQFQSKLTKRSMPRVQLRQADVLALDEQLPASWTDYDLIVSTSMLEYVPLTQFEQALAALHKRIAKRGRLIVVITRKNILSRIVIEWGWQARGHTACDLKTALVHAGFSQVIFHRFPLSHFWLNITNYVVIAG